MADRAKEGKAGLLKHLANEAASANPLKAFTRAKIVPPASA